MSCFQDALKKGHGAVPWIGCTGPAYNTTVEGKGSLDAGKTVLSEVWYYYHVAGAVQGGGRKVPVEANSNGGSVSNCAKAEGALKYPERSLGSEV